MTKDIGPDAIALAVLVERTHGHRNPPPAMSFEQVNMICETLRDAAEEIFRLHAEAGQVRSLALDLYTITTAPAVERAKS